VDLNPYVESLRHELAVAAEAGGDEARALAERLAAPLESATRLLLLEALSAAADEITRDLAPGSVEVRLRGRDPELVVSQPPVGASDEPVSDAPLGAGAPASSPPPEGDDGGTARITLRLPEHLKPRIDEAANQAGLSVNAWLVRVIAAALEPGGRSGPSGPRQGSQFGRRYSGWVR
jgi:hypothetical protein